MAKRTIKSVLIEARDYISNRRNWTQGLLASRKATKRDCCYPTSEGAKVCALGAVSRALGVEDYPQKADVPLGKSIKKRLDKAAVAIAEREGIRVAGIIELNDYNGRAKTHPLVLEAFDKAIGK